MTNPCPICGKPACRKPEGDTTQPFCSRRCADVDLGRWLTGAYVAPGPDGETLDDEANPSA